MDKIFVVENAGNTCYIDSLIMALFYSPSAIDILLKKDVQEVICIYLQEYILKNFVNNVRRGKSVLQDTMHLLRELLISNGWKAIEQIEQQDINEFYVFLMDILEGPYIDIKKIGDSSMSSENDEGFMEKVPYISLTVEPGCDLSIKELFKQHTIKHNRKIYNIVNSPSILSFSIKRYGKKGEKNVSKIQINTKIKPQHNIDLIDQHVWTFQSAICHKGTNLKSGHYYTLLYHENSYYIFDDLCIPSLRQVNMKDSEISHMIKTECVLIIYRFLY